MPAKVVDASAVVALLFNELTREAVLRRLRSVSLHAPALIEFEVASACLKKIRAAPEERDALLAALSLLDALAITIEPINRSEAIALAAQTKLTFYDACYLWLARALGIELVTLDATLARADKAVRSAR